MDDQGGAACVTSMIHRCVVALAIAETEAVPAASPNAQPLVLTRTTAVLDDVHDTPRALAILSTGISLMESPVAIVTRVAGTVASSGPDFGSRGATTTSLLHAATERQSAMVAADVRILFTRGSTA